MYPDYANQSATAAGAETTRKKENEREFTVTFFSACLLPKREAACFAPGVASEICCPSRNPPSRPWCYDWPWITKASSHPCYRKQMSPTEPSSDAPSIDELATLDPLASYDPEKTGPTKSDVLGGSLDPFDKSPSPSDERFANTTLSDEEQSQIAEICRKFESDWREGKEVPSVERYIPAEVDLDLRMSLVRALILLDIEWRKRRHKSLQPAEYLSRFPDCQSAVQSALSSSVPPGRGGRTVPMGSHEGRDRLTRADDAMSRYRPMGFHAKGGLGAVYRARRGTQSSRCA